VIRFWEEVLREKVKFSRLMAEISIWYACGESDEINLYPRNLFPKPTCPE